MQDAGELARASLGWVNVGLGAFVVAMVVVLGFLVWAYRDKLRDARALVALVALLISLPLAGRLVLERTSFRNIAVEELKIAAVEVIRAEGDEWVIYLTLSRPAVAYAKYKDIGSGKSKLIFALGKVEPRVGHTFIISGVGREGGEVVFVINGQEMLWSGVPLMIVGK